MKIIENNLYDNVPYEMKDLSRWIKWKKVSKKDREGNVKCSKIPYSVKENNSFNWNKSINWETYNIAKNYIDGYDGLGYVLVERDNIVAIDLDNCIKDNRLSSFSQKLIEKLDGTYMELSQSEKGIHIFLKGSIPRNLNFQNLGIEIYKDNRYIALTANMGNGRYFNPSRILLNKQKEIKGLHDYCINKDKKELKGNNEINTQSKRKAFVRKQIISPVLISYMNKVPDINTILDTMDRTNSLASSLISGNSYTGDNSRDDFIFLLLARNYTHKDLSIMKELFLMTSLNRLGTGEKRKCDGKYMEYLSKTIDKALGADGYRPFDWTRHNEYIQRLKKYEKY